MLKWSTKDKGNYAKFDNENKENNANLLRDPTRAQKSAMAKAMTKVMAKAMAKAMSSQMAIALTIVMDKARQIHGQAQAMAKTGHAGQRLPKPAPMCLSEKNLDR